MNWTKQAEEMVKTWTEAQQNAWQAWQKLMDPQDAQSQMVENWQQMMALWEEAVKNSISAQNQWMQTWADMVDEQMDVPDEIMKFVEQAKEISQRWAENQEKLWQGWFDLMKQAKPTFPASGIGTDSKKVFEAWQESTKNMMDAQTKWMNMFANHAKTKEHS